MSSPTRRTLTATFQNPDGTVPTGRSVTFLLLSTLSDLADNVIVTTEKITETLDNTGSLSVSLVSDAGDVAPQPVYFVRELFGETRGYNIVVPAGVGSVDLTDLAPVGPSPTPPSAYQLLSEKGQPSGYASLGSDGLVPTAQLPASSGGGAVASVNGHVGVVVLGASDVGADASGAAAAAIASSAQRASNLSDLASAATARTNLGLGSAATQASTAFDAAGAASTAQAASLQKTSNLSDVASAATARTNLGLGSAATQASTAFDAAGAAAAVQAVSQPLDPDLTAIAALDASTAGAIGSDGAGWVKKTYAQLKTALGLVKADVGLGNVDNTADASKPVSTAQAAADAAVVASSAQRASNLSDLASATTARTNLGLGTAATHPVGDFALAGSIAYPSSAAATVVDRPSGWFDIRDYGAKIDGRGVLDAVTTSASGVVTSATAAFTAGDVGKKVFIQKPDGTVLLNSTVASYQSATQVTATGTASASATGATLSLGTDDTTAIQAAITAAAAVGGGTIYGPRGISVITSLTFPAVALSAGAKSFTLLGETSQDIVQWGPQGGDDVPVEVGGFILRTFATSGAAVSVTTISTAWGPFSNIAVNVDNVLVRAPNNPACDGLDLSGALYTSLDGVTVGVFASGNTIAQPTHSGATGIKLPAGSNGATVSVRNSQAYGFDRGIQHTEHAYLSNVSVAQCNKGVYVLQSPHAAYYDRVLIQNCIAGVVPSASGATPIEGTVDFERAVVGHWFAGVNEFDDVNNWLSGNVRWHLVVSGTGVFHVLNVNGAQKLNLRESDNYNAKRVVTANTGSAFTFTDPAAGVERWNLTLTANCTFTFPTAAAGREFVVNLTQDGTGSRTVNWGSIYWPGGTTPTLSTAAGALDQLIFRCIDGSHWQGNLVGAAYAMPVSAALQLQLDASTLGLADAAAVSTWTDLSTFARSATAAGAARPTFKTAIQNGLSICRFAGSQSMATPAVDLGTSQTVYVVCAQTSTGEGLVDQDPGGSFSSRYWQFRYNGRTGIRALSFAGASLFENDGATNITTGAWTIGSMVRAPGSIEVWSNGVAPGGGATSVTNTNNSASNAINIAAAGGSPFTGDIGEIRVYNVAHDTTTRRGIEAALSAKWNIPVT